MTVLTLLLLTTTIPPAAEATGFLTTTTVPDVVVVVVVPPTSGATFAPLEPGPILELGPIFWKIPPPLAGAGDGARSAGVIGKGPGVSAAGGNTNWKDPAQLAGVVVANPALLRTNCDVDVPELPMSMLATINSELGRPPHPADIIGESNSDFVVY